MPVTLDLLEGDRIIKVTFTDPWTIHEMREQFAIDQQIRNTALIENPNAVIHLIVDLSQTQKISNGFLQARNSPSLSHPTSGHTVVIANNRIVEAFAQTGFRLVGYTRVQFMHDLDSGLDYLRARIREENMPV